SACSARSPPRRPEPQRDRIALAAGALFVRRQPGGGARLEARVRNRLAALGRDAVRAGRQPRLGALDGGELLAQVLAETLVELVLVEIGGEVGGVDVVRFLAVVRVAAPIERPLDSRPLGGEKLACAIGVHAATLVLHGRGGSCCTAQRLPSGSSKKTNEPHGKRSMSVGAAPRARSSAWAASMSATTSCARAVPGATSVIPTPSAIEQAEPGGVSCTKRSFSSTVWSWSAWKPACST